MFSFSKECWCEWGVIIDPSTFGEAAKGQKAGPAQALSMALSLAAASPSPSAPDPATAQGKAERLSPSLQHPQGLRSPAPELSPGRVGPRGSTLQPATTATALCASATTASAAASPAGRPIARPSASPQQGPSCPGPKASLPGGGVLGQAAHTAATASLCHSLLGWLAKWVRDLSSPGLTDWVVQSAWQPNAPERWGDNTSVRQQGACWALGPCSARPSWPASY